MCFLWHLVFTILVTCFDGGGRVPEIVDVMSVFMHDDDQGYDAFSHYVVHNVLRTAHCCTATFIVMMGQVMKSLTLLLGIMITLGKE